MCIVQNISSPNFTSFSSLKETVCRLNSGAYSIEIFSGALPYPCDSRERENGGFVWWETTLLLLQLLTRMKKIEAEVDTTQKDFVGVLYFGWPSSGNCTLLWKWFHKTYFTLLTAFSPLIETVMGKQLHNLIPAVLSIYQTVSYFVHLV